MKPRSLNLADWKEIMHVPAIREAWDIGDDMTPDEFRSIVYGVKFRYVSGSPGYIGDLFILQGDVLGDRAPMVLKRTASGRLSLL